MYKVLMCIVYSAYLTNVALTKMNLISKLIQSNQNIFFLYFETLVWSNLKRVNKFLKQSEVDIEQILNKFL